MKLKRKHKKEIKADSSKEGFEYCGIRLTDKQYSKLVCINSAMNSGYYEGIPVFPIVLVLKALDLIPGEMTAKIEENKQDDFYRIVGKMKEGNQ